MVSYYIYSGIFILLMIWATVCIVLPGSILAACLKAELFTELPNNSLATSHDLFLIDPLLQQQTVSSPSSTFILNSWLCGTYGVSAVNWAGNLYETVSTEQGEWIFPSLLVYRELEKRWSHISSSIFILHLTLKSVFSNLMPVEG